MTPPLDSGFGGGEAAARSCDVSQLCLLVVLDYFAQMFSANSFYTRRRGNISVFCVVFVDINKMQVPLGTSQKITICADCAVSQ